MKIKTIKKQIQKISMKSGEIKCLTKILYELLNNNEGNLAAYEINTLCFILKKNIENLNNRLNNLEIKLKI